MVSGEPARVGFIYQVKYLSLFSGNIDPARLDIYSKVKFSKISIRDLIINYVE